MGCRPGDWPALVQTSAHSVGSGHYLSITTDKAVHLLVRLHPLKEEKKFEDAIRTIVREAVLRAELEGYRHGYEDGKRRAVN